MQFYKDLIDFHNKNCMFGANFFEFGEFSYEYFSTIAYILNTLQRQVGYSIHLLTPYISAVFYTHPFANFLSLPPCQLSTNFMDGPLHMCENNQKKDHLHNRGDTKCVSNIVHKKCTGQW